MRGIRKLDIDFSKQTFAICGPNGSGKSGVIDAIEFGLTGQIGRLSGSGTKGLSVPDHGPHIDKTRFPDAAFVQSRSISRPCESRPQLRERFPHPRDPKSSRLTPDVRAALEEVADHPEITLFRRDILRFILVEPTKRSEEIQTLLKLEEIGQTRSALNSAQNKLQVDQRLAAAQCALVGKLSDATLRFEFPIRRCARSSEPAA